MAGGLLGAAALALAGCGTDRGGSVALGDGPAPAITTPANSGVVFVPLDSPSSSPSTPSGGASTPVGAGGSTGGVGAGGSTGGSSSGGGASGGTGGTGARAGAGTGSTGGGGTVRPPSGTGAATGGTTGAGAGGTSGAGSSGGTTGGGSTGGTTPSPPPGGGTGGGAGGGTGGTPQTPAALAVTALHTEATAQRWCQTVTLTLANSGDLAATSGTVTFATHVIGALGIDWWTYRTSQPLAVPVAGHTSANESWTVCVDAWRVPAGMHLETRAATLG